MFDIDSGKLLIVAVLALIVIGPKELPRVLRQVGQAVGKMRRMATEFQGQFMDAMKEADIADIRKDLDALSKSASLDVNFNPARDIQAELTGVMKPLTDPISQAVSVPSPIAEFELPPLIETAMGDAASAGIAPVAEPKVIEAGSEVEPLTHQADADLPTPEPTPVLKRKIFVKRRSSSFHRVRLEAKAIETGMPVSVRRRSVRSKTMEMDGVQTS